MTTLEKIKMSGMTWDSDGNPAGFTNFIYNLDSMARTVEGGTPLTDWLDCHLVRKVCQADTIQSHSSTTPHFAQLSQPNPR